MTVRRVLYSDNARAAFIDVFTYTKYHWGHTQAKKYLERCDYAIRLLVDNPALGHVHPCVPERYLAYGVGSHLILYTASKKQLTNYCGIA